MGKKHKNKKPNLPKSLSNRAQNKHAKYEERETVITHLQLELENELGPKKFAAKRILHGYYSNYQIKPNYKMTDVEWEAYSWRQENLAFCRKEMIEQFEKSYGIKFKDCLCGGEPMSLTSFKKFPVILQQHSVFPLPNKVAYGILEASKTYVGKKTATILTHSANITANQYLFHCESSAGKYNLIFQISDKYDIFEHKAYYTMNAYVLIDGNMPIELFRYDSKHGSHRQRMKNGKIWRDPDMNNDAHLHIYDEKFLLIFPNSFCHYDAEVLPFNSQNSFTQAAYIMQLFHFDDKSVINKLNENAAMLPCEEDYLQFKNGKFKPAKDILKTDEKVNKKTNATSNFKDTCKE